MESLEWTTGMEHWTGLLDRVIFLFGQVSELVLEAYFLWFTSIWLLWMIVTMTTVAYYSVFINISKHALEDTVYCKLSKVKKFSGFWQIDWQATMWNFSNIIILLTITFLCEVGYGHQATVNVLSKLQLSSMYNCETSNNLQYTVSTYLRNYRSSEMFQQKIFCWWKNLR